MTTIERPLGLPLENLGKYPELPVNLAELYASREADLQLTAQLFEHARHVPRFDPNATGYSFYNRSIAEVAQPDYTPETADILEKQLHQEGTLTIPTIKASIAVDGKLQDIWMMPATETGEDGANHGDMSEIWYLRDQAQAAIGLIRLGAQNGERYDGELELGKRLLMSVMHAMSTESQLERFDTCIKLGPKATQEQWPHISIRFKDLEATGPNGWRNQQDSLQMITDAALEAMQLGALDVSELAEGNKKFLGSVVPLLRATGHPMRESSGTWEEFMANRTSVMAVEASLLHRMHSLLQQDASNNLDFLRQRYQETAHLLPEADSERFDEVVSGMLTDGLAALGQRLPFESPEYTGLSDEHRLKYREADAALAYVLMYRIPQLLADHQTPMKHNADQPMTAEAIEDIVLEQMYSLQDERTHGIVRYKGDSYQRPDFHTGAMQLIIGAIKKLVKSEAEKQGRDIDLVKKQGMRDELMLEGPEAAWLHPLGQLASWAAERSLEAANAGNIDQSWRYHQLSTKHLNQMLANVTGDREYNLVLDAGSQYAIKPVRKGRFSECRNYHDANGTGTFFDVPSAHTGLNWAAAAGRRAVGMHREATSVLHDIDA